MTGDEGKEIREEGEGKGGGATFILDVLQPVFRDSEAVDSTLTNKK